MPGLCRWPIWRIDCWYFFQREQRHNHMYRTRSKTAYHLDDDDLAQAMEEAQEEMDEDDDVDTKVIVAESSSSRSLRSTAKR